MVQPDLFWIASGGACVEVDRKYFRGAPDLVVEVASPGTVRRDKRDKLRLYEKHGVREYWLVDLEARLIEAWPGQAGHFIWIGVFGAGDPFTSPLLGTVDLNGIFAQ